MWRLVLTVSLLCWGCEAQVTCRDNNNGAVDWYILYKAPRASTLSLTGLEYLYIDSNGVTKMDSSEPNYKAINNPNGVLANTLRPLFTQIRSMPANFGFISYSDQPPGCNAFDDFGHSKGVLMMDKTTSTSTGVWLLHSTPRFPFRRDQNTFWPDSGTQNAQTFICVTFPYSQFGNIGTHLQYIGAFPFDHDLPDGVYQELKDAVNWKFSPPSNNFQRLTSSSNTLFHSIAKQQAVMTKDGDLYVTIAEAVSSDLFVQTWGRQHDRARSYCVRNKHKVYNINIIKSVFGGWQPTCDHSKWCVAKDNHWTCIADVNRASTQFLRRGGALCIENVDIAKIFQDFAGHTEDCIPTTPNTVGIANCDTDTLMG